MARQPQTAHNVSTSERLKRLRGCLHLSQRELAAEFKVTGAAIAQWESGARPVPGPILRLLEIYEESLGGEQDVAGEEQIRKLSTSWAERILPLLPQAIPRDKLQKTLLGYLRQDLSGNEIRRKIQLAMLEKIVDSVGKAKGVPMKVAQLLTYMNPSISPEIRQLLLSLQYAAPPMAPTVAARVVYEEFGRSPRELFAEWSPRPFAIASVGQVHLARLHSGERVAVKVQYPDVAKSLESDLRVFSFLNETAMLLGSGNREILTEIRQAVLAECDYTREADRQEEFRRIFENDPQIVIPRVHRELSGKRVLTTEYIDGRTLREFLAHSSQEERDLAGKIIWRFGAISILQHSIINADHHSGNFLFLDGKVAFLDFGRAVHLDPSQTATHRRLNRAIILRDREAAREIVRGFSFVRDWDSFDFDEFWTMTVAQQKYARQGKKFRFTREFMTEFQQLARGYPGRKNLRLTSDMLWNFCSCNGLGALLSDLGAEAAWGDLMLEHLEAA